MTGPGAPSGRARAAACALFLLAALAPGVAAPSDVVYETVRMPKGTMWLEVPTNSYLQTDFVRVPVQLDRALEIGRFEVSNAQWNACFAAGGCRKPAPMRADEGPDHPVTRVNWHEAQQFSRWLSRETGRRYRLPTEHEWFFAFSLGRGYRVEEKVYDYADLEAIRAIPKRTWPRGHFGENAWGLADTLGNVWEWTLSCYTLAEEGLLRPPDPARLADAQACTTRIVGGEHRAHVPDFIADTYNGGCATLKPAANLGFRLVLEPEETRDG